MLKKRNSAKNFYRQQALSLFALNHISLTNQIKHYSMGIFSSLLGNAGVADNRELQLEYGKLLTDTETIEIGFKLIRDVFIFTNKRLILVDKQGITGKKVDYMFVIYKSITRFSIETAGHLDLDAELKIWVSSETNPSVAKRFNKNVNIYDLQKVLATHVLG